MPDYKSPYQQQIDEQYSPMAALSSLLKQKQQQDLLKQHQEGDIAKVQQEHALKEQGAQSRLEEVLGALKSGAIPQGAGLSIGPEGAAITRQPNLGVYDFKKQQFDQTQANKYSKGLEKYSDLNGAAQDLERITNRDGSGGIFTNPNAKLVSGGKVTSAVPDAAMGLSEMFHISPEGSAEERKALSRYKLAMGHALTGARMNPTMQKMIQDSLGGMASGDPQLMAKGLRGSARIIGGTVKTVQGGFSPEVRGQVHDQMGGDPMELFGKIPLENELPVNHKLPPDPRNIKPIKPSKPVPQAAPQSAPGAAPQTQGFDPDAYLKSK